MKKNLTVVVGLRLSKEDNRKSKYIDEVNFYKKYLNCNYQLKDNNQIEYSNYNLSDKSKISIGFNTAILKEAFGRQNKILTCNFTEYKYYDFPVEGFWSIKEENYEAFKKIFLYIFDMKKELYISKIKQYSNYVIGYDNNCPTHIYLNNYIKKIMNNKSVLITGGTGSFGNEFVSQVLKKYPKIKRLVIFSRDELKQYNMQKKYPKEKFKQLRFFIGDIRDKNRLNRACENIDIIIHAAALKQVETAEYNPTEFIETNIKGSQNIIEAAIQNKIKKVVALSTDKAAAPINLYGATKMCSDKLFIAANNYVGNSKLNFVVVRYGNVLGSRGSVLLNFQEQKINGVLKITDPNMTRFSITLA